MSSRSNSLTVKDIKVHRSASSVSLGFGSTSYKQVRGLSNDVVVESLYRLLPEHEDFVREQIVEPFCVSEEEYEQVQALFSENLERGLNRETHDTAAIKMYTSFVRATPDGTEKGKYIAIDFEGNNFRLILVTIGENEEAVETRNGVTPSKFQDQKGEKLFDFLADSLHRFLKQMGLLNTAETIPLGLTFAFPCRQTALNKAVLKSWAKHFQVNGVEGCEIVGMLNDAIKRKGFPEGSISVCDRPRTGLLAEAVSPTMVENVQAFVNKICQVTLEEVANKFRIDKASAHKILHEHLGKSKELNVECVTIVNDTVGTLMSGALHDQTCSIGLILSKGTNACYKENIDKVETWDGDHDEPREMIINTEWKGFGEDGCLEFIRTEYDRDLEKSSKHPGNALYEKMIGGQYLGEIVRLVLQNMRDNEVLFLEHWSDELGTPRRFYTKYISEILSEEDIRFKATRHVYEELHLHEASELECRVLHHICQLVSVRAVTLTAIGLACLINRMGHKEVAIAVDGALYRFHPFFPDMLTELIPKYLDNKDTKFCFVPATDGKGKGAAIAAAVAERLNHR